MNTPGRIKFSQLPVLSEVDDSDEVLFRDVDGEDPAQQVGRLSIATLRAAMGGGADDWSEFPATSSVDMDGHGLTNLPAPSAASDAATKGYVDARPGADAWSEHPATQDVDLDGHKITGLGAPTEEDDAATKGYVDAVSPTKIERTFSWGRSVAEVTDNGDVELAVYLTGQANPLRRVRVPRGNTGGGISIMNRAGMWADAWVNLLEVWDTPTPGFRYELSGGPPASSESRGRVMFSGGRFSVVDYNGVASYLSDSTYRVMPAGVGSYKHAAHLAKQAYDRLPDLEWWEPVWTPVENVDSVSNVECSYTRVHRASGGSLVTLEGTIEVEIDDDSAPAIVTAALPVPATSVEALLAPAMGADISRGERAVCAAGILDMGSGTALMIEAELAELENATGVPATLTIGFRISYRAA